MCIVFKCKFLDAQPAGTYQLCWCQGSSSSCQTTEDIRSTIGLLILKGPFSNQSFQCDMGSHCAVSGLRGSKLLEDDQLLSMHQCGTSLQSSMFPNPRPIQGKYDVGGDLVFDLGILPLEGFQPETIHLCWCSFDSNCVDYEDFRVEAIELEILCPPGTYELTLTETSCHECPPGYFCPGGSGAELKSCDYGSTSAAGSTSLQDCVCRHGFWNAQGTCIACSIGSFKDSTGPLPCQSCPSDTTTAMSGASRVSECICANNMFDTDPDPDVFNCTSSSSLSHVSGGTVRAASQIQMHIFNGSMLVDGVSVSDVQSALTAYLSQNPMFGRRASLALDSSDLVESSPSLIDFEIMSSEESLAMELQAMFDPISFAAWTERYGAQNMQDVRVVERNALGQQLLRCPQGLGFPPGSSIRSLTDCKCPYGMEPARAGSTGLEGGCVECPRGQHKTSVADSSCQSCGLGSTTQQTGAISAHACTCAAGSYITVPNDPTSCQTCGQGYFCHGAAHREACAEFQTTLVDDAAAVEDCVCAEGHSSSASGCLPCAPGSFKVEAGNDDCRACPIGTWTNATGVASPALCIRCMEGSTTDSPGAVHEDSCIRPRPGHEFLCTSGQVCSVQIQGFQLRKRHRLAITSGDCARAVPVPNIAREGMTPTDDGSNYSWGQGSMDFIPQGGFYALCWCVNLRELTCDTLQNYHIMAGQVEVVGPFSNHLFQCVRGHDCSGLQPLEGVGLVLDNQVALRSNGCGSSTFLQISVANSHGIASLESLPGTGSNGSNSFATFSLSFGTSIPHSDHTLLLDSSESGYDLCWCGQSLGSYLDSIFSTHVDAFSPPDSDSFQSSLLPMRD